MSGARQTPWLRHAAMVSHPGCAGVGAGSCGAAGDGDDDEQRERADWGVMGRMREGFASGDSC